MSGVSPTSEESICIGCGLCCDGTLHAKTTVRPDDEPSVTEAGLEIGEEAGKRFFRQPCPHFSCGSCLIYEKRPGVCRTYRCALLKDLEAGRVTRTDALEKIATAKDLLSTVRNAAPGAVTPRDRSAHMRRLKAELRQADVQARQRLSKLVLDVGVLEHFLNRWFLRKDEEPRKDS